MTAWVANRLKKIGEPIQRLLRQGASPNRLAAGFALGAVIGLFPVVGATTALCTVVAVLFRFNLVVIQLANYLVYPLQLALLIPFAHLGAVLFQAPPPPLTADQLVGFFSEDFLGTLASFSALIAHAVAAWMAAAVPLFAGTFLGLSFIFKGIARRRAAGDPSHRHPASAN